MLAALAMATALAIQPHDAAQELLRRIEARRSLLAFADYTHPRWQTGSHHRKICDFLERVERGEIKRGIITAPPRHTKSELASRRFPAWYLGRNPTKQIITATYAADFAVDFGADVRDIINGQDCRNIFPRLALHPDRRAASRWRTKDGGIYVASGIGGPITGRGADLADIDDPFKNREDADSARKREKVWRWFNSTLYTRLMPEAAIILMMTRWHEDDLAGRLLKQGGWELLELQAIANEDTDREEALWPGWFPIDVLREKRSKLPEREWRALYQQRPTSEGGSYCKREWFDLRCETLPTVLNKYLVSDLAVTDEAQAEGRGPDYSEHGVLGIGTDDHVYPADWWHGRTTPDVTIDRALDLAKAHDVQTWFMAKGVIRRALEGAIEKRMSERKIYVNIEYLPEVADKAAHGRAFQGRASMRTWHFPRGAPWADRVIDQVAAFPGGEFDDAFDVCSLFGRAINETLVAKPEKVTPPPGDRWADSRSNEDWKTPA